VPFPTVEEFRAALLGEQLPDLVRQHLINDEVPFAFRSRPAHYASLKQHVAEGLGVSANDILVIGSAKIGFSLDPDSYFRSFSTASDIDVLVTNAHWFDTLWLLLLTWHYQRWHQLEGIDWKTAQYRMTGIYQGWISPDRARTLDTPGGRRGQLRDMSTQWFDTFRGLSRFPEFARREVSGRLYRSQQHALLYQMHSLRRIRAAIAPKS